MLPTTLLYDIEDKYIANEFKKNLILANINVDDAYESDSTPEVKRVLLILLTPKSIYSISHRIRWLNFAKIFPLSYILLLNIDNGIFEHHIPVHFKRFRRININDTGSFDGIQILKSLLQEDRLQADISEKHPSTSSSFELLQDVSTDIQQSLRTAWARISYDAQHNSTFYDALDFDTYENKIEAKFSVLRERLQSAINKQNLSQIKELLQNLYCIAIPKTLDHDDPEMRELYYARAETSVILQYLCDKIGFTLEKLVNEGYKHENVSYANRLSGNPEDNRFIFRNWMESHSDFKRDVRDFAISHPTSCFYRADIRRFYPTIPKKKLLSTIQQYLSGSERQFLPLLEAFLSLKAINSMGEVVEIPGVPAGIPLSHILANVYLYELDLEMKKAALNSGYFRYADDIFVFGKDMDHVVELENLFTNILKGLGLHPHPKKSEKGNVANTELLTTLLDGLSPFLNPMDFGILSVEEKQWYANTIYSIINPILSTEEFDTEFHREDTEEALARYGAVVVRLLRELGYESQIVDRIAYELLRKTSLRAHHVRQLVEHLINRFISGHQESEVGRLFFQNFLPNEAYEYVKIVFLQILGENAKTIEDDRIWQLVVELFSDPSMYVSGEAALVLQDIPPHLTLLLEPLEFENEPENSQLDRSYVHVRQLYLRSSSDDLESAIKLIKNNSNLSNLFEAALQIIERETISL